MKNYSIDILGKAVGLTIFEALVDDSKHPAMLEFETLSTAGLSEKIQVLFITFKPNYANNSSEQWLVVKLLQDRGSGYKVIRTKQANFDILPNELVTVDLGQGPQQVERFKIFRFLSENGMLQLPENYINGLINYATETAELFPDLPNPIYIDRSQASQWPRAEAFLRDGTLIQPFVVTYEGKTPAVYQNVVELQLGLEVQVEQEVSKGSISFQVHESEGNVQYKVNEGEWTDTGASTVVLSGLSEGSYQVGFKDSVSDYLFEVVVEKQVTE